LGAGEREGGNVQTAKIVREVGFAFGLALNPVNLRFRSADMMAPSNSFKVLPQVRVQICGNFWPGTVYYG
jgi:hypothetical protein